MPGDANVSPASGAAERQLVDAILGVTTGLSLPAILERVIVAACVLVDAQYGALGVIGAGERARRSSSPSVPRPAWPTRSGTTRKGWESSGS